MAKAITSESRAFLNFTRASEATFVDSDGFIKTAKANEARLDHDPITGEPLGLLVEEQRTNELLYSRNFEIGYSFVNEGSDASLSFTKNFAIAPDGTQTALRINPDFIEDPENSARTIRLFDGVNSVTGQIKTFSVFVKPVNTNTSTENLYISLSSDKSSGRAFFNLTDKKTIITQGDISNATFEKYADGWYRVSATYEITSDDPIDNCFIALSNRIGQTNFDPYPTGEEDVYIWGAQVEQGTFPTSYIPTNGSEVTRAADNLQINNGILDKFYKDGNASLYVEAEVINPKGCIMTVSGSLIHRATIGDSGDVFFRNSETDSYVHATEGSDLNLKKSAIVVGSELKHSINGSFSKFSNEYNKIDFIRFGYIRSSDFSNNRVTTMYVKDFKFFPRALNDFEMIELTSGDNFIVEDFDQTTEASYEADFINSTTTVGVVNE